MRFLLPALIAGKALAKRCLASLAGLMELLAVSYLRRTPSGIDRLDVARINRSSMGSRQELDAVLPHEVLMAVHPV